MDIVLMLCIFLSVCVGLSIDPEGEGGLPAAIGAEGTADSNASRADRVPEPEWIPEGNTWPGLYAIKELYMVIVIWWFDICAVLWLVVYFVSPSE